MHTALLLIDIQNDYFPNGEMELFKAGQASEKAQLLLKDFRAKKKPVIHIMHESVRPNATFFIPGTRGIEIHANVAPTENEEVVVKHFPNSFRETQLLEILKNQQVEHLVICGMMTHMCVDATVRAAKDYGFECTVIGDACATRGLEIKGETVNAADVQNSFLSALSYYYTEVLSVDDYLKK